MEVNTQCSNQQTLSVTQPLANRLDRLRSAKGTLQALTCAVATSVLLAGCMASGSKQTSDVSDDMLFQDYQSYAAAVADNKNLPPFFSTRINAVVAAHPEMQRQYTFATFMADPLYHASKAMGNDRACMLINGTNEQGEPVSLSLAYLQEADGWKIDGVNVAYYKTPKGFTDKALCPDEVAAQSLGRAQ
ncbi:hypothetical protein ACKC9G_03470 [Pokkaliibacter sp. CJK22405]|uniref:hypothetical protein n=1 Tax=Pokkaliibacter sp. CJK22405 TaxID=3384615 RepID=UPI0039849ED3